MTLDNVYISNIPKEYSNSYIAKLLKDRFANTDEEKSMVDFVKIEPNERQNKSSYGFAYFKSAVCKERCIRAGYLVYILVVCLKTLCRKHLMVIGFISRKECTMRIYG
jgi:hypothetical protein